MARFKKAALTGMVHGQFEREIEQHEARITELEKHRPHDEEVADWRDECRKLLVNAADGFTGLTDEYVARFRLPAYPNDVQHEIDRSRQYIARLVSQREHTLSLVAALAEDKDGSVVLTMADVRGIGIREY